LIYAQVCSYLLIVLQQEPILAVFILFLIK
jgi:hypothetical protein